jgi:hypothetical protein
MVEWKMVNQTVKEEKSMNVTSFEQSGQASSLELIWRNAIQELDTWAEQAEYYDQVLLNAVRKYMQRVNQNRENIKVITDQFNSELREWEETARGELLMTTTMIKQLYPKKSYQDINHVMDDIHNKLGNILMTPVNAFSSAQSCERYTGAIEQLIVLRKNSRQQFVENVKQAANVMYGSQKMIVDLFQNQFKTVFFPLHRYLEKSSELTKF